MRTDAIDQAMAIALHPAFDCRTALLSAMFIRCLTQSPEAHLHLVRTGVVEDMLEMCALRLKLVSEQSPQPQAEKEDPMMVKALQ